MPASRRSLEITERYRDRLANIRERLERDTRARWPARIEDFDKGSETWLSATAARLAGAQREAVRATQGYLAAFLASELGRRVQPPPLDTSPVGEARSGDALTESLQRPLARTLGALKDGADPPEALKAGITRAMRVVEVDLMAAAREALRAGMEADERIVGWKRAVRGTCDACMGDADGETREAGEPLDIHPNCECVAEPKVRGLRDRFPRPTGKQIFAAMTAAEQDAQFGPEKAAALRAGEIELSDLVLPQEDGQITAKPLKRLDI